MKPLTPDEAQWWSRQIRGFFRRSSTWKLLPTYATSWSAGGCEIVAQALRRWLGPHAVPVYVYGTLRAWTENDPPIIAQHACVFYRGYYWDGEGVRTRERLERRWREELYNVGVDVQGPPADDDGWPWPRPGEVKALYRALTAAFSKSP